MEVSIVHKLHEVRRRIEAVEDEQYRIALICLPQSMNVTNQQFLGAMVRGTRTRKGSNLTINPTSIRCRRLKTWCRRWVDIAGKRFLEYEEVGERGRRFT